VTTDRTECGKESGSTLTKPNYVSGCPLPSNNPADNPKSPPFPANTQSDTPPPPSSSSPRYLPTYILKSVVDPHLQSVYYTLATILWRRSRQPPSYTRPSVFVPSNFGPRSITARSNDFGRTLRPVYIPLCSSENTIAAASASVRTTILLGHQLHSKKLENHTHRYVATRTRERTEREDDGHLARRRSAIGLLFIITIIIVCSCLQLGPLKRSLSPSLTYISFLPLTYSVPLRRRRDIAAAGV
jgi:hypothetical protein